MEIKILIQVKTQYEKNKNSKIYILFFQFFDLSNVDKQDNYSKRKNNDIKIKIDERINRCNALNFILNN